MISVDARSGRTAAYDPMHDTWTNLPRSPVRFFVPPRAVWTSRRLIAVGRAVDDRLRAVALDPHAGWARLPDPPIGGDVVDTAWTGTDLVVVTEGLAVEDGPFQPAGATIYDPSTSTWCTVPPPPLPGRVDLVWTGIDLLAFGTPWPDPGPQVMSRFDTMSAAWSAAAPMPLAQTAGDGLWTGDALLFLGDPSDGLLGDASYDPATDRWQAITTSCMVRASNAIWTGDLVIDDVSAWDPRTGDCYRVPYHRAASCAALPWCSRVTPSSAGPATTAKRHQRSDSARSTDCPAVRVARAKNARIAGAVDSRSPARPAIARGLRPQYHLIA